MLVNVFSRCVIEGWSLPKKWDRIDVEEDGDGVARTC